MIADSAATCSARAASAEKARWGSDSGGGGGGGRGGATGGRRPGDPVPAELVCLPRREACQVGTHHLALLAEGAGDQRHFGVRVGRVARDRAARGDRLVVG